MDIIIEGFGGEIYKADTHAKIVDKMRASAWGGDTTDGPRGYMRQVAKRVWDWCAKTIRTDKAEDFLTDLQDAGLIKVKRPGEAK
jgi:hypothetical protein